MAQALLTRMEIKNRHCERNEQALSLSPSEDKKITIYYLIKALDITVKSYLWERRSLLFTTTMK